MMCPAEWERLPPAWDDLGEHDDWAKCFQSDWSTGNQPHRETKHQRGQPPSAFIAAVRASPSPRNPSRKVTRQFLDGYRWALAQEWRAILNTHRADRRDECQRERRAAIFSIVASRPRMSASSLAAWLRRIWDGASTEVLGVAGKGWLDRDSSAPSERTLRKDIAAIRKAGTPSPPK